MNPRIPPLPLLLCLGLLAGFSRACTSDADSLGPSGFQELGGMAGMPPQVRPAGGIFSALSGGAPAQLPEAPRRSPESPGSSVITFLHGVVDAPRISLCFAKSAPGGLSTLSEFAWPTLGLGFGESLRLDPPGGLDLDKDALVVIVVAGEAGVVARTSCASIQVQLERGSVNGQAGSLASLEAAEMAFAGTSGASFGGMAGALGQGGTLGQGGAPFMGSGIRARVLSALAPGSFRSATSYLFAATGCLGAVGQTDPFQERICGSGYTPKTSTLTPLLVSLSRITQFNAPGLQILNASLGAGPVSVLTQPGPVSALTPLTLLSALQFGELAPHPPFSPSPPQEYWVGVGASVRVNGNDLEANWRALLQGAGLTTLEVAKNYSLVLLGPAPEVGKPSWWNPSRLSLLPNDPAVAPAN